jgi:hypothetical protein
MKHRFGQCRKFRAGHTTPKNGHQKSGNLIVGDALVRRACNEEFDFFAGKFRGIAFLANEVNSTHQQGCAKLASRRVGVNHSDIIPQHAEAQRYLSQ